MKKKYSLTLDSEFLEYCELNNIEDSDKLAKDIFSRGFSLIKYGETPVSGKSVKEKIVEKEIIKEIPVEVIKEVEKIVYEEKIVEVPIEKIVEVIKEVPVEIKGKTKIITKEVIKEVPIEKIIEVKDNKEIERLIEENKKLKEDLEKINKSLEKFNKGRFLKNSDLGSLYDE
jgi:hypothetical protein